MSAENRTGISVAGVDPPDTRTTPGVGTGGRQESGRGSSNRDKRSAPQQRRTEYRLVYQRCGWSKAQQKLFGSRDAVDRFVVKLTGDDRPDLARLVVLRVEARPVGPWSVVETIVDGTPTW